MLSTEKKIKKHSYYLRIAQTTSEQSTCLRRQYGAVIVKNDEIISNGYNGSPRNVVNCNDFNRCVREANNIEHGERYELCQAVHAEQNAIISAKRSDMIGATIYIYGYDLKTNSVIDGYPCLICQRFIINAGIEHIIMSTPLENGEVGIYHYKVEDMVKALNEDLTNIQQDTTIRVVK